MSAADYAREELEAAIWRHGGRELRSPAVKAILDIADIYAEAVADERIAGRVHERAAGRERLADLAAALGVNLSIHYTGKHGAVTACQFSWHSPPPDALITPDVNRVTCRACKRSRGYKDDAVAAMTPAGASGHRRAS